MNPGVQNTSDGCGIGCVITHEMVTFDGVFQERRCIVTKILQGGAAAFSGRVNVGDHILAIDGAPTKDITEDTIRRWFIGEPGTAIVLKIQDALTREERSVKLIRQPLADIPMAGIVKPGEELAGIGAVLVNDVHGNVVVAKLIAGGAASYCKPSDLFGEDRLKRNDHIVAIDGRACVGVSPADLKPALLGPVGSEVTLSVKRTKYEVPIDITIRRRAYAMQTQFVPFDSDDAKKAALANAPPPPPPARPSVGDPGIVYDPPLPAQEPPAQPPAQPPAPAPVKEAPLRKEAPADVKRMPAADAAGLKVGVGLVLRERSDGSHTVKRLKPGQAAEHCGQIEPGDLLSHVDALDIARGAPSSLLADLIAGPQGTVVNLSFEKPDGRRISINLLRGSAEYIAAVLAEAEQEPAGQPEFAMSGAPAEEPRAEQQRWSAGSAGSQRRASAAEDAVGASLEMALDYDELISDMPRLHAFNQGFKADVCAALGCAERRVQLIGLQRTEGIIVDMNFLGDPSGRDARRPAELAAQLAAQAGDAGSPLLAAQVTRAVQRVDVHDGPVLPPPDAAVVGTTPPASAAEDAPPLQLVPAGSAERLAPPPPLPAALQQPQPRAAAAGVGLVLREDPQTGEQTVRRLGPGQSAERSGQVRIGDVLLAVDGQPVAGRDLGELMLGAEGSLVQLSFHRPGLEALDFTATLLRGSAEFVAAQAAANAPQAPAPSAAQKKAEMLLGAPPAPATAPFPPEAPAAPPAAPVPARTTPPAAPDGGGEVRVALQLRGAPDAALVPMVLPQTWAEFLGAASVRLQCGEVTRVFNDAGQPLMGMGDIAPGEKLLVHAAAKGQFEGWSAGMVIKRRYVLSTRLGEAGLGQLWQAVDTSTGLEVTLTEEGDETALAVRDSILAERGAPPRGVSD